MRAKHAFYQLNYTPFYYKSLKLSLLFVFLFCDIFLKGYNIYLIHFYLSLTLGFPFLSLEDPNDIQKSLNKGIQPFPKVFQGKQSFPNKNTIWNKKYLFKKKTILKQKMQTWQKMRSIFCFKKVFFLSTIFWKDTNFVSCPSLQKGFFFCQPFFVSFPLFHPFSKKRKVFQPFPKVFQGKPTFPELFLTKMVFLKRYKVFRRKTCVVALPSEKGWIDQFL